MTAAPITAEYTFPDDRSHKKTAHAGETAFGEVVDCDEDNVYVAWQGGTKVERFSRSNPEGVVFKDASGTVVR